MTKELEARDVSPAVPSMEAGDGMERWEVWRVTCGRDSQGRFIKDWEIDHFIADVVSPRFEALTIYSAHGYWKGKPEAVTIFEIAGPADGFSGVAVADIAEEYRARFSQECVMVSHSIADVKFV